MTNYYHIRMIDISQMCSTNGHQYRVPPNPTPSTGNLKRQKTCFYNRGISDTNETAHRSH